jgi:hypothetical protein
MKKLKTKEESVDLFLEFLKYHDYVITEETEEDRELRNKS